MLKEHICILNRHRQQFGDGQRETGWEEAGGGGQREENEDICNSVNNKTKAKKVYYTLK